jgi:hypothetical protein
MYISAVHGCLPGSMARRTVRDIVLAKLPTMNALPWSIGVLHGCGDSFEQAHVLRMMS